MTDFGYLSDMAVVDSRLTKLEEDYNKIIKLLNDLTKDLSKIGGKTSGKQEKFDKSSKGQKSI